MKKQDLQELCDNLERDLNLRDGINKKRVELFSGLMPYDYHLSSMHLGTTKTLNLTKEKSEYEFIMAWFVEIRIDGKCIFREFYIPNEKQDSMTVEDILITRILRNIFTFGVMSSKKFLDENKLAAL